MARSIHYFLRVWASAIHNLDETTNTSNKREIRYIKKEAGLHLSQRKLSTCVFTTVHTGKQKCFMIRNKDRKCIFKKFGNIR